MCRDSYGDLVKPATASDWEFVRRFEPSQKCAAVQKTTHASEADTVGVWKLRRLGTATELHVPATSLRPQDLQDRLADTGGLIVDDLLTHFSRRLVERKSAATARILASVAGG
jgi:hypothetical protein